MSSVPVFVGGVGGSGTRLLAVLLRQLGYHIGKDLNVALDNLWFTALFKRPAVLSMDEAELARFYEAFRVASSGIPPRFPLDPREIEATMLEPRKQHQLPWLRARAVSMLTRLADPHPHPAWAWKEPNVHLVARRLLGVEPEARYIHLARNGLDVAFSRNQNQVRFWGGVVVPEADDRPEPIRSLKYWCWSEQRARCLRDDCPERVLWIRFEDLCARGDRTASELGRILGRPPRDVKRELVRLVDAPPSIGRFRRHDREAFDEDDMEYVASLGFSVE